MRQLTEREAKDLKEFFSACNQLIAGNFILSDLEVEAIIKSVHTSFLVKQYVDRCLVGFNFENELKNAKPTNPNNNGHFKMPPDDATIVALTYSVLLSVYNKKLNLQTFIFQNFYSTQGYDATFSNFTIVMLNPFKSAVKKHFKCNENGELLNEDNSKNKQKAQQISVEQILYQKERKEIKMNFNELKASLTNLVMAVRNNKKLKIEHKENFIIVANAIMQSAEKEDLKMINALVVSFEYILGKNRHLRPHYHMFLESIANMI